MDNIYTKSCLKDFLNKTYFKNLDNKEITDFLSKLITDTNNHFNNNENNYLLMLIITCINKTNLTYQNKMLINEIINTLLLDQLEQKIEYENKEEKNEEKINLENLDLDDKEAVKKYFLQENKHLENHGNFPYPQKGKTSVIISGDNMTIPGVRYTINYIIDYKGDIIGIQGYPKKELTQAGYETIYTDLMNSIFQDDKSE